MLIPDSQRRSGDLVAVVAEFADRDVRGREHAAAVIGKEGRGINEAGVGGIFKAQERRGDDREAVIAEHKRIACGSVGKAISPDDIIKANDRNFLWLFALLAEVRVSCW